MKRFILTTLSLLLFIGALHAEDVVKSGNSAQEEIYGPLPRLFDWEKKTADPAYEDLQSAQEKITSAKQWTKWLLDESFQPRESDPVTLSTGEVDTFRQEWKRDEFQFQVAQTNRLFTILITLPKGIDIAKLGNEESLKQLSALVGPILSTGLTLHTSQGEAFRLPLFREYLQSSLFINPPQIIKTGNILSTLGNSRSRIFVPESKSKKHPIQFLLLESKTRELGESVANTLKDPKLQNYPRPSLPNSGWFCAVQFWTDGNKLGFWYLKQEENTEAGVLGPYKIEQDQNWFSKK